MKLSDLIDEKEDTATCWVVRYRAADYYVLASNECEAASAVLDHLGGKASLVSLMEIVKAVDERRAAKAGDVPTVA